ncbi:MAG: hypothetical protein Kapaf2KO_06040 [Candidatus Kapaibacteriales bacterium]
MPSREFYGYILIIIFIKSHNIMDINNLVKIGVFYDGNFLYHVSNYYNYFHDRKSRLSIKGLHEFIRHQAAKANGDAGAIRNCQIVDAHYFRGRLSASEANQKNNQLYYDRVFDDVLSSEGVATHYLPIRTTNGHRQEKGIDVWLALETFELAFYKKYDIVCLIASDGDYVPLIRKLNALGVKVMLLAWDFEYTDDFGNDKVTRTSQDMLDLATIPVAMHEVINNRIEKDKPIVNNLFVHKNSSDYKNSYGREFTRENYSRRSDSKIEDSVNDSNISDDDDDAYNSSLGNGTDSGSIMSIKNGYGFIKYPPNNLFFHFQDVLNVDFNELQPGDKVYFRIIQNEEGEDVATDVELA